MRLVWIGSALVALAACGDGDAQPTMTSAAMAGTAVTQTTAYQTATVGLDGNTASTALVALGLAAQSIEQPQQQTFSLAGPGTSPNEVPGPGTSPGEVPNTGTCTCTSTGCTFSSCADDASTWTMNGAVTVAGDNHSFDLGIVATDSSTATRWTWQYQGSITITSSVISGHIQVPGAGVGVTGDTTAVLGSDWALDYNAVQLDAARCAVGGSITASRTYEAESLVLNGTWAGTGTVTFGPACGQTTVVVDPD